MANFGEVGEVGDGIDGGSDDGDLAIGGGDDGDRIIGGGDDGDYIIGGGGCCDTKEYKNTFIRHGAHYADVAKALDMVKAFIIEKQLIIYGGMCIDLALKAAGGEGIYPPDEVPDYDFMSPNFYSDAVELARQLFAEGFGEQVNSINAKHVSTRKVRLGGEGVADITYIPAHIYKQIPRLKVDEFAIVHPDFQRLDLHRAMSLLLEGPPVEVIAHRTKKDVARYQLLDAAYPIEYVEDASRDKLTTKVFKIGKGLGGVINGSVAMAKLLGYSVGVKGDELTVEYPEYWGNISLCVHTDEPYKWAKFASASLGAKTVTKYYSRYLDGYHPRMIIVGKGDACYEIADNLGSKIPVWSCGIEDEDRFANLQMATAHFVALYMLLRNFNPHIVAELTTFGVETKQYKHLYSWLAHELNVRVFSKLGDKSIDNQLQWNAESNRRCDDANGWLLTLFMYGKYNWPLEYIYAMSKDREHMASAVRPADIDINPDGKNDAYARPTVKLGFYPDRGQMPEPLATDSELFLRMDGAERPPFTAITIFD